MRYVERDENGEVTGSYANQQPNYAEECLEDDDPDLIAFKDKLDRLKRQGGSV